jgi:hypothetical protein
MIIQPILMRFLRECNLTPALSGRRGRKAIVDVQFILTTVSFYITTVAYINVNEAIAIYISHANTR